MEEKVEAVSPAESEPFCRLSVAVGDVARAIIAVRWEQLVPLPQASTSVVEFPDHDIGLQPDPQLRCFRAAAG